MSEECQGQTSVKDEVPYCSHNLPMVPKKLKSGNVSWSCRDRKRKRERSYRRRHGLSLLEREERLAGQKGLCPVCLEPVEFSPPDVQVSGEFDQERWAAIAKKHGHCRYGCKSCFLAIVHGSCNKLLVALQVNSVENITRALELADQI